MEDLLRPVKTAKKVQNNIDKFESLSLRETSTNKRGNGQLKIGSAITKRSILEIDPATSEEPALKLSQLKPSADRTHVNDLKTATTKRHKHHDSTAFIEQSYLKEPYSASLSDNAREILNSQPSHEDLVAVLKYLQFGIDGRHEFNIHVTGPKAAQIINTLVTSIIPSIWTNLKQPELSEEEGIIKGTIISSLTSIAGIGALLTQIKQFSIPSSNHDILSDTIEVLAGVLKGRNLVFSLLQHAQQLYPVEVKRKLYWQEATAILGGSRVLSSLAQALSNTATQESLQSHSWLGNGMEYTKWLGRNISNAAVKLNTNDIESWQFLGQLAKRGMSLGHRDCLAAEIYTKLLLGQRALWTPMHLLLKHLAPYEQKSLFDSIMSDLAQRYFALVGESAIAFSNDPNMQKAVAGAAALIAGIVSNNEFLNEHAETWLAGVHSHSSAMSLPTRRALVAALGHSEESLQRILERSLTDFGDRLQIQHASILQQETMTQSILLIVGCLNRINVHLLKHPSISTLVMQAVSNRLAATILRPRLLGMIVGTAISRIVDKKENIIDFGAEEMQSEDVALWLNLVSLDDRPGDIADISSLSTVAFEPIRESTQKKPVIRAGRRSGPVQTSKVIAIEEVNSSTESEDEDLIPYQKPDSDAEDSEEDPTLINRSKPSAPVYILDLIKQLQTPDKPDVVELALRTAPGLIRRKTGFGTELFDNIHTLVTVLINLQTGISEVDFQQLRLEALIACIVAKPVSVGPSLADTYFRGDFSTSQRISLLTAVGLSVRELAGFKDDRALPSSDQFPSKRLPAHLEPEAPKQLSATSDAIAMLTDAAAQTTIRPMALAAADKMTGPSVLKIRTFSSRMEVEKRNQAKAAARSKNIPKNLHKILIDSIYVPFCSRMSLLLSHTVGGRIPNTTVLHSSTVRLFLQTLTLVLHTLGPSASIQLSTLSHETLLLLLNLHSTPHLSMDPAVLPVLLHLLLALLDVTIEAGTTAQEMLIKDHGAQVTELVGWSNSLGGRISVPDGGGEDNGMPWSVLAAGIQVKWFEMGRKFQGRMLGLTVDDMDNLTGA